MANETATQATAAAQAEANGTKRKRLPEVDKVFKTKAEVDAGQKVAREKGHTYDTRKFRVIDSTGKVELFVLAYSPANAASQVWDKMGVQVEEVDPSDRVPFQQSPEKSAANLLSNTDALSKLPKEQRDALIKALQGKK